MFDDEFESAYSRVWKTSLQRMVLFMIASPSGNGTSVSTADTTRIDTSDMSEVRALPLSGVRVVEVGVWHAGPGAGAILADLGAEVIKIEDLGGDPERHAGVTGPMRAEGVDQSDWTVLFDLSNRGKKGIGVDLRTDDGREIVARLTATADVFITNLRDRSRASLGIDYPTLSANNPKLVYASVTGFGQSGPLADWGGYDTVGQAVSGMMWVLGGDEPVPMQMLVLDQFTSIAASHAILTALVTRELQGIGQDIHVSLLGSAMWLMQPNLVSTSASGTKANTTWDRTKNSPLRNTFRAGDGGWFAGTNHPEDAKFPVFCNAVGLPELISDPRFSDAQARKEHYPVLISIFDEHFLTKSRDEWVTLLVEAGLVFAPVLDFTELLTHPQAVENGYITNVDHPVLGRIGLPAHPVHFGRSAKPIVGAAPRQIGEDTRDVLRQIGYSPDEVEALIDRAAVRVASGETAGAASTDAELPGQKIAP